jgi:type I restriction enzyme S subunit
VRNRDWAYRPLSDLVETVFDRRGVTPEKLGSTFVSSGCRVISAKHIKQSRVDLAAGEERFVDANTYARWMRSPLLAGDVLVTSEAPLGEVAFVDRRLEWCLGQRLFGLRPRASDVDGRFLYFALKSREVQADIQSRATGTTAQGIRQPELLKVVVPVPPLAEQRAISDVLGALDNKIDLNIRMNETLETMRRALFRSWFMDFDPVRNKMAGAPVLFADPKLFPDVLIDSALGPIPNGWHVHELRDRTTAIQYGLTTSATRDPVGPKFLRITDIQGGRVAWGSVPYCTARDVDVEKYRIHSGDIFVARTGASTGESIYVVDPPEAVFASYLVRLRFSTPAEGRFVAAFMRSERYRQHVASCIGGSAQPNASAQALAAASTAFPPLAVLSAFHELLGPLDAQSEANNQENAVLASLRDLLLPRLLTGDLRIRDAVRAFGATT